MKLANLPHYWMSSSTVICDDRLQKKTKKLRWPSAWDASFCALAQSFQQVLSSERWCAPSLWDEYPRILGPYNTLKACTRRLLQVGGVLQVHTSVYSKCLDNSSKCFVPDIFQNNCSFATSFSESPISADTRQRRAVRSTVRGGTGSKMGYRGGTGDP